MRKALQAPGHPLGQLDQLVKVGQAAPDFLGLGLGAVARHKVSQEVEQEKGHQVGIVMVQVQLVQEERVDWEVAQVSMTKCSSIF